MLNGIDISSWQGGIDISKLSTCDFVIIKATEGTDYINPDCERAYQQAKSCGKKLGVYHFANGYDAIAEADYFVRNIRGYIGEALLVLDFEADVISKGVSWARTFCERVKIQTGVTPMIYMSSSVCRMYDWSPLVSDNIGLWVADYPNVLNPGFDYDPEYSINTGAWSFYAIWQYCSDGRIPGYGSDLDLNHFYGSTQAWDAYAGKGSVENIEEGDGKKYVVIYDSKGGELERFISQ